MKVTDMWLCNHMILTYPLSLGLVAYIAVSTIWNKIKKYSRE